jgi:outer membrane protein
MKKVFTLITLALTVTLFAGQNLQAQTDIRFAHINNDMLMRSLPETDTALAQLDRLRVQYSKEIEELQVELNNAVNRYQNESANWSELVRSAKENELNTMNSNIESFAAMAQQEMQQRQAALLSPIYEKVQKAIQEVAKEHGFVYVFDVSEGGTLIYVDDTKSTDIMDMVKAKLTTGGEN